MRKTQYLMKWMGKFHLTIRMGQQSWVLNDELDMDERRRETRWKEGNKQMWHVCSTSTASSHCS